MACVGERFDGFFAVGAGWQAVEDHGFGFRVGCGRGFHPPYGGLAGFPTEFGLCDGHCEGRCSDRGVGVECMRHAAADVPFRVRS